MNSPRLRYLPLGGLGEVGINMWALEWENKVLVVDAGLMFPQEDMLGIDLVLPDISYLLQRDREVLGIFLTHGHEDHIGGLPFALRKLNVPVYGTRLTLGLVKPKLREHRILRDSDLREVRVGDSVQLGPFRVETIAVCHSIPDAVALSIETPVGRVVYTSDFKLDPAPPDGLPTNMERFRKLGDAGVLLLLSDSTNSERNGHSGSERDLHDAFERIFSEAPGRIVVANFASNIHRMQHLVRMAAQFERRIAIVGRSLQQNFKTARELGFLSVPDGIVIPLADVDRIAPAKLLLLTAGSQGEPMSALTRFAAQRHPFLNVRKDDWVVISARPIPGNERMVHQTVNNLYRHGARVFYSEVGNVHVTGHAQRDELREMLDAVRPRFFVPVHGEYRQLLLHSELAREAGLDQSHIAVVEDGESVELDAETMERGEKIGTGLVYVDGLGVGDVEQIVLRDRRHLAEDGILVVTLTLDRDTGAVRAGPELVSRGVIEPELSVRLMADAREAALDSISRFADSRPEVSLLQEAIHDAVSQTVYKQTRRRPMVIPVVTEI
ncbi:MAG: ribonuclease J [Chloroflexi bacterium 13_1_40CM_4_65_16]|nr:MAG: ribonuclease J [Chloroflexi bacterium 13_1_40CM_4_65_16]OLD05348.1 MAG: ribonuclease J [Actinobacteria bacterium 13_1_40CM_3_66_19]OLE72612.1 MAG: ribonuclease J [Actinobacteria bacterium 13_1_20CM_2_66_18]TMG10624.1 MAG: ribonuclease J [Chloroflexota bacterium]